MSGTVKVNNVQLGDSATAANNFVLSVPATPDGTVKLSRGNVGATTQDVLTVDANGKVTINPASLTLANPIVLGYGVGAGGGVTQLTSKATAVTLNKPTGLITMNNASLAANSAVAFQFNNSLITAESIPVVVIYDSVGADGIYSVQVTNVRAGYCLIVLRNHTASTVADAVSLNFAIISGART